MQSLLASESKRVQSVTSLGTTTQNLVTFSALSAGLLNHANNHLSITVNGRFTTSGGETPILNFSVSPISSNSSDFLRTGVIGEGVEGAFRLQFDFLTDETGSSGDVTMTGRLDIELNGRGNGVATYLFEQGGFSNTIDLTASITPSVQVRALLTTCSLVDGIDNTLQVFGE